ncbi:uncharacterized protein DNG_10349 [Cephalotrichum gorgonifer]|uniref:CENP-V/GFA domain-containing protein n=1 Tax=Cephalotrichum gorgonifer TaxID=2041049 RepID=A0AAE8N8N5_9PEZI|nr:uncharacterized protein DNG_10349 [Cephalotrichum gorgonifer]
MDVACQCKAVTFKTPTLEPLATYVCHCTECQSRTGSAFGASAIFPKFTLPEGMPLACYARLTSSGDTLHCYFCKNCGTRILHTTAARNVVSVKGGCIPGLDWTKAIHVWASAAMVPIPEGCERYAEDSTSTSSSEYGDHQKILD